MKGKIHFEEVQSFVGTWIWYVLLGTTVFVLGAVPVAALFQPVDTTEALIGTVISVLTFSGVIFLFATSKLYVTIDDSRIYYRFPPFVSKEKYFSQEDVQEMQLRKYHPIREYGGYGYRLRFRSGRVMNVAGNMGLQLVLKNGKKVLIGTQKPDSMRTAISRLQENWQMNG
ncbi:MAG: hypothetical protein ABJP45_12390 [Cyclobacteriaceae bacterium]